MSLRIKFALGFSYIYIFINIQMCIHFVCVCGLGLVGRKMAREDENHLPAKLIEKRKCFLFNRLESLLQTVLSLCRSVWLVMQGQEGNG